MQALCLPPGHRTVSGPRNPVEGRAERAPHVPGIHCRHAVRPTQDITPFGHVRRQARLLLPAVRRRRRVVGTLQRAGGRPRQALHRVGRLRPAPGRGRHRGIARPRADAGGHGHHSGAATWPTSSAAWRRSAREIARGEFAWSRDLEDVHLNIERRLTDAGRRRRQAAAHRPLAQRPGRDRHAAVAARRDRRAVGAARGAAPRAARPGRAPRRHDHAGLHAPAGRAAGHVRPSPDGLRRDVRARRRAAAPTAASA